MVSPHWPGDITCPPAQSFRSVLDVASRPLAAGVPLVPPVAWIYFFFCPASSAWTLAFRATVAGVSGASGVGAEDIRSRCRCCDLAMGASVAWAGACCTPSRVRAALIMTFAVGFGTCDGRPYRGPASTLVLHCAGGDLGPADGPYAAMTPLW